MHKIAGLLTLSRDAATMRVLAIHRCAWERRAGRPFTIRFIDNENSNRRRTPHDRCREVMRDR
jgi:hypothetical protein